MTRSGDDGRYEAPIGRLVGAGAGVRRGRIAAIIVTLVVGSAVGLAILPGRPVIPAPTPRPSHVAELSPSTRATSSRVEALADLPDRAIAGAPRPVLVERRGDDARLVRWTPGQGLSPIAVIPGAFAGLEGEVLFVVRSPASGLLFVLSNGSGASAVGHARVVGTSGSVLWDREGVIAAPSAVWSSDGSIVAAAAPGGQWRIVSIRDGVASGRVVDLPSVATPGAALPSGAPRRPELEPETLPLGFSADGRWVYGAFISPQLSTITTGFRVSISQDRAERVATFGVGRPDGLAPLPGTIGARIVDPSSGRIADWRANSDFAGGPPTVEVREPDGAFAFAVDAGTPLGSAWDADGSLYVLSADSLLFPDRTSLVRVERDGSVGRPIFETGPVAGSSLLGVWNGFAALGLTVGQPSSASQLVLVDLAEPTRRAAVDLVAGTEGSYLSADLAP
jgi:hypothetical protein